MASNDLGGVWRTVGGRRIFIKDGQDLASAMIESGKFKNLRSDYRKAKEEIKKEEETSKKEEKKEFTKEELKQKYGTDNVDLINAGKEKEDRVSLKLSEKQVETGNKLNENAEKGVREDIKTFLSGKEDYDGSKEDFIRDLSNNWGVDKDKVEDILNEENSKSPRLFKNERQNQENDKVANYFKEQEINALKNKDMTYGYSKDTLKNMSNQELDNYISKQEELAKKYANDYSKSSQYDQRYTRNRQDTIFDKGMKTKYEQQLKDAQEEKARREAKVDKYFTKVDNNANEKKEKISSDEYNKKLDNEYNNLKNGKINTEEYLKRTDDIMNKYTTDKIEKGKAEKEQNNKDGFTQHTDMYGGTREYSKEQLDKMQENGVKPMEHSYTGGGWEGTKYDSNLTTKDIAKNLNDYSKKEFPDVKLSRKTDYNGIDMYVMSSGKDMFVTDSDIDKMSFSDLEQVTRSNGFNWWAKDNVKDYNTNQTYSIDDVRNYAKETLKTTKGHDSNVSGNEWYLSDYGKKVISGLNKEMNSYNYDDSDGMVDYFNTNFYGYVHIGKWDKPYEVSESKSSGNQINDSLQKKAYQKYMKEHPGSKMSFEDFKK